MRVLGHVSLRAVRPSPAPLHGGPLTLLRFMRAHSMLTPKYVWLIALLLRRKFLSTYGRRLDAGRARVHPARRRAPDRPPRTDRARAAGRGSGTARRSAATRASCRSAPRPCIGQECTISAYQHVSIGRECVIADRVMLIDFDHGMVEVDRPIRLQGIYKRDVRVGNNVWIGYGACILRGVTVGRQRGDRDELGGRRRTCRANAVVGGVPARVIRMRDEPQRDALRGKSAKGPAIVAGPFTVAALFVSRCGGRGN